MSLLGPILGLAGSILSRPKRVSGYQSTMEAASGAIAAQEAYGINALELIRSGSAGASSGSYPRVGSIAAMTNSFDQISDILSGKAAQEEKREKVRAELERIELDTARAELAKYGTQNTGVPRNVTKSTGFVAGGKTLPLKSNFPAGTDDNPTLVTRPDGLTSVNNESPVEFEGDLWGWARDGTLLENAKEIFRRNKDIFETFSSKIPDKYTLPGFLKDRKKARQEWIDDADGRRQRGEEKRMETEKRMELQAEYRKYVNNGGKESWQVWSKKRKLN